MNYASPWKRLGAGISRIVLRAAQSAPCMIAAHFERWAYLGRVS